MFHGKIHYFDWAIFNCYLYVHQRVPHRMEAQVELTFSCLNSIGFMNVYGRYNELVKWVYNGL